MTSPTCISMLARIDQCLRMAMTVFVIIGAFALASPMQAADDDVVDYTVTEDLAAARRLRREPALRPIAFRTTNDAYFTEAVRHGETRPLKTARRGLDDWTYVYEGETYGLRDYLARTYTNGFAVLHKGALVAEAYRNGATPSSTFQTFSVSKSITSLLLGAAIDDGVISGVDAQITDYVPSLKGTGYDGVTIEQALQMRSGVDFQELGDDGNLTSQIADFVERVATTNQMRCVEYAGTLRRIRAPGAAFNYATPETCVLSAIIENATNRSLADYMSEKIWRPIGAEADAYWVMDGPPGVGRANAGGGFGATVRDLARLGQMVLNGGRVKRRQIISSDWLTASTIPSLGEPVSPEEQWGYQYQWWTLAESDAIAGHGVYGQFLFIDPENDLVIVKMSYWPNGWDYPLEYETMAGFRAIATYLKQ